MPWLVVNKFTVLTIEDPNTIDSELIDTPPLTLLVPAPLLSQKVTYLFCDELSIDSKSL